MTLHIPQSYFLLKNLFLSLLMLLNSFFYTSNSIFLFISGISVLRGGAVSLWANKAKLGILLHGVCVCMGGGGRGS